jgi:hypothetical protein
MSRKSQAFAQGQVIHSWRLEKLDDGTFEVSSKTHPSIKGRGEDEQTAIRAAKKALEVAVEKVEGI